MISLSVEQRSISAFLATQQTLIFIISLKGLHHDKLHYEKYRY